MVPSTTLASNGELTGMSEDGSQQIGTTIPLATYREMQAFRKAFEAKHGQKTMPIANVARMSILEGWERYKVNNNLTFTTDGDEMKCELEAAC